MGVISSVLLGALAIFGAVCVKVFADEFKAWAPTIVAKTIEVAVQTLPAELRERFSEEWSSHTAQIPGDLGKITGACGFLIAALDMANGRFGLRKRVLDLAIASILLAFFAPLFMIAALLVRLDAAGPTIVRQTRIGHRGKLFEALKFRTTYFDSDSPGIKVTAIGALLRSTSLDELPQLLNVLSGDMSLVGPRSLTVKDDAKASDLYKACKPGMTGLWMFGLKDIASYAGNWSLKLDAKILLGTIASLIRRRNDDDEFYVDDLEASWKLGLLVVVIGAGILLSPLLWSGLF